MRTHESTDEAESGGLTVQRVATESAAPEPSPASASAAELASTGVPPRQPNFTGRRAANAAVLGLPLVITATGMFLTEMVVSGMSDQYTASSAVAFSPKITDRGLIPGSESLNQQAAKYVPFLDADPTVQAAAKASGISIDDLGPSTVTASIIPGTATLSIAVENESASRASAAANSLAAQVLERTKTDTILTAEQIAAATPPTVPSGPPRTVLTVVGTAASILLGLATLLGGLALLRFLRTTPKGQRVPAWLRGRPEPDSTGMPGSSAASRTSSASTARSSASPDAAGAPR